MNITKFGRDMMRHINFSEDVSPRAIGSLLAKLQKDGRGQQVWINSDGGTFEFFSVLAPQLLRQGFTAVGCDVRSAAIILYLLGSRRYVLPDAVFFFHEVRAITKDGMIITVCDFDEAVDWAKEREMSLRRELLEEERRRMKNTQSWMLSFISEQSGIPQSTFLSLMRSEATISASEAVHYGLARRIVSEDELCNNALL